MPSQLEKARVFKQLHDSRATFTIPNPWDAGSALLLQQAGFKALATTSSGFAVAIGKVDGQVSLQEKLDHCRLLASVTDIPISADFENGFADTPQQAARNLLQLAATGVVGASIEDWANSASYDFDLAVARIEACAEAAASLPYPFILTARAEGLLRNTATLDEVINRLQAFEQAGADVLYAPGLKNMAQVEKVLLAINKPLNVLAPFLPEQTLADYASLGVARVSIGGALAQKVRALTATLASDMLTSGSFA